MVGRTRFSQTLPGHPVAAVTLIRRAHFFREDPKILDRRGSLECSRPPFDAL